MRVAQPIATITVSAILIGATMIMGAAALSIPNLFSMPALSGLSTQTSAMPFTMAGPTADEPFTLSVSGNVYYDKIPVNGADVTIYLNGNKVGETTAGDMYMFEVTNVRNGDTIRVDASYQGNTGTASDVVKLKNMNLDVYVDSGHSFIRSALEMLPDMENQQQQQAENQQAEPQQQQTASSASPSSMTTNQADTDALLNQVNQNTADTLGQTLGEL